MESKEELRVQKEKSKDKALLEWDLYFNGTEIEAFNYYFNTQFNEYEYCVKEFSWWKDRKFEFILSLNVKIEAIKRMERKYNSMYNLLDEREKEAYKQSSRSLQEFVVEDIN